MFNPDKEDFDALAAKIRGALDREAKTRYRRKYPEWQANIEKLNTGLADLEKLLEFGIDAHKAAEQAILYAFDLTALLSPLRVTQQKAVKGHKPTIEAREKWLSERLEQLKNIVTTETLKPGRQHNDIVHNLIWKEKDTLPQTWIEELLARFAKYLRSVPELRHIVRGDAHPPEN